MTDPLDTDPTRRADSMRRVRKHFAVAAVACLTLLLAACGGSDDGDGGSSAAASSSNETSSESSGSSGGDESAAPSSTIDLTPVSDCIAAADIVVAPSTLSESFMAEQGLIGVLDLGALGNEFGGGRVYFYEEASRAEAKLADLAATDTRVVRVVDNVLVDYDSAVSEEAAQLVLDCAA